MVNEASIELSIGRFQLMKKVRKAAVYLLILGSIFWVFSSNARPNVESIASHLGASDSLIKLLLIISIVIWSLSVMTFIYYLFIRERNRLIINDRFIKVKNENFKIDEFSTITFIIRDLGVKGYGNRGLKFGSGNYISCLKNGEEFKWEFFIKDQIRENAILSFANNLSQKLKSVHIKKANTQASARLKPVHK